VLNKYELKYSLNLVSCCTNNVQMESFYHSLKIELIRGSMFGSLKKLHSTIGQYIKHFYITAGFGINCRSPAEYEEYLACLFYQRKINPS
jgi:putative transposase